jgi:hypothetical protein
VITPEGRVAEQSCQREVSLSLWKNLPLVDIPEVDTNIYGSGSLLVKSK